MKNFQYYDGEKDKEDVISSMQNYVKNKQEMDKLLEKLIIPYIQGKNLKILDACCGIGHLSLALSELSPESTFTGIDKTPYLIEEAKKLSSHKKNIFFEIKDINELPKVYPKKFDITINWKTISWLPYYEEFLKSLIQVTKYHIFLSSMFYDGDIDFEIKVREYKTESGRDGHIMYYNVYSFPHFKEFVHKLGVKNVEAYDFKINIDLSKPNTDRMGTYTVKLENGERLQISGAVVMSWKIIRLDLQTKTDF